MLNVLAKVADEMPPERHERSPTVPVFGASAGPVSESRSAQGRTGQESVCARPYTYPFDRRRFLGMYRQASRNLDPDPYMGMAVLEQGLDQLFDVSGEGTRIMPGEEVVYSRVDQPRRDVRGDWDVLTSGLLAEIEVDELVEVYWTRCNPITRLLDPSVYTLQYIRSTSCLLFAVILQVSAQCLPASGHSSSLVARLDNHIDRLLVEITQRGLQSLEICQALLVFATWLRADKQYQTWQLVAQVIGMATELRLDANASPIWYNTEPLHAGIPPPKGRRNIQRFWIILSDWDRRLAFIRGRKQLLRDTPLTSRSSLTTWWTDPNAFESDVMTCASMNLRIVVSTLQQDIQRAMTVRAPLRFEDHLATVDGEFKTWRAEWCALLSEADKQRSEHDLRALRLVLLMIPYDHRLGAERLPALARDECLVAALDVCKHAIPLLGGVQPGLPVHNVTAARLYLLGYTSLCALRIMSQSTTEDRSNVDDDLFHLSILSALATRLCTLNVHRNVALIASVLGRRLLDACRKVTSELLDIASEAEMSADGMSSVAFGYGRTDGLEPGQGQGQGHARRNVVGSVEGAGSGLGTNGEGSDGLVRARAPMVPVGLDTTHEIDFSLDFGMFSLADLFPLFDPSPNGIAYESGDHVYGDDNLGAQGG